MFKLVEDWKKAHTWISAQMMVLANAVLLTWATLPAKFQESLPIGWVISLASTLLVVGTVGRVIDQKPKNDGTGIPVLEEKQDISQ